MKVGNSVILLCGVILIFIATVMFYPAYGLHTGEPLGLGYSYEPNIISFELIDNDIYITWEQPTYPTGTYRDGTPIDTNVPLGGWFLKYNQGEFPLAFGYNNLPSIPINENPPIGGSATTVFPNALPDTLYCFTINAQWSQAYYGVNSPIECVTTTSLVVIPSSTTSTTPEILFPTNFWFTVSSATSTLDNGILTTIVTFNNNPLPAGLPLSEIGRNDYKVYVQPLLSDGTPLFASVTYFVTSDGEVTETVIETRQFMPLYPTDPTSVYIYIQKDVPDVPFGNPYASNFLTIPITSSLPPDPQPEGLCGNNFFSPCILPLEVVGNSVVVTWHTPIGEPDAGYQVWSSIGEPVLLSNPTFINHLSTTETTATIPFREGLCVSVQAVWLLQYYRSNTQDICLDVSEPTSPQNIEITISDGIGISDFANVTVNNPTPDPDPIPPMCDEGYTEVNGVCIIIIIPTPDPTPDVNVTEILERLDELERNIFRLENIISELESTLLNIKNFFIGL